MKLTFLRRSLPLILAGIALGYLARFILGVPESTNEVQRKFNQPLDEKMLQVEIVETPDFELKQSILELYDPTETD